MSANADQTATILFGAFDRHNFGDLLFPHVVTALLGKGNFYYAGLANRDLRAEGGHQVTALPQVAAEWRERPANIIHVGGELLTCTAWEAAVMLLTPPEAQAAIACYDALEHERLQWAQRLLDMRLLAPYSIPPGLFRQARKVIYNGVGGVELSEREPAFRAEVLANLRAADYVGVRDRITLGELAQEGIAARLMPDPAVMVAELFGEQVRRQSKTGEPARIRQAFPQGYVAVQFSADFGDDATLAKIAAQLDQVASETALGIVFFRAGAAPWHDDSACYRRAAAKMREKSVRVFESLDIWDICALIAHSRAYCGSSLHGRIIAMAFALPRVNLLHPALAHKPSKQDAFATTWEAGGVPLTVGVDGVAHGISLSMEADQDVLRQTARRLAGSYREAFGEWSALLGNAQCTHNLGK